MGGRPKGYSLLLIGKMLVPLGWYTIILDIVGVYWVYPLLKGFNRGVKQRARAPTTYFPYDSLGLLKGAAAYNANLADVTIAGTSAGGHLAALLLA